jgi:hypothetical protein
LQNRLPAGSLFVFDCSSLGDATIWLSREYESAEGYRTYSGKWAIGASGLLIILLLYVLLGEKPYGIQIATLIAYSMAIFFFVFMRSRLGHGFALTSDPVVRSAPRLLLLHLCALTIVFALQTIAFRVGPYLPSWWLHEDARHHSPLDLLLLVFFTVFGVAQAVWFRSMLSKA